MYRRRGQSPSATPAVARGFKNARASLQRRLQQTLRAAGEPFRHLNILAYAQLLSLGRTAYQPLDGCPTRPLAACHLFELRRAIAAREDRQVRVAPSRSPRASARRRGALEFTPHFAGLSHHQKSASRDQEVAPPARHAASEPPNTATHFCSPVRAPKTRSRAAPSTAAASRPGEARSFGVVR